MNTILNISAMFIMFMLNNYTTVKLFKYFSSTENMKKKTIIMLLAILSLLATFASLMTRNTIFSIVFAALAIFDLINNRKEIV